MRKTRSAHAALAAVVAMMVTGCAATTGMTGLTIRDDQVIALVRICEPYTSPQVEIWGFRDDSGSDYRTWAMSGSVADVDLGGLASIALLIGSESAFLGGVPSGGVSTQVEFTINDLRDLREGDVLADGGLGSPTVQTLDEFEDEVDQLCN